MHALLPISQPTAEDSHPETACSSDPDKRCVDRDSYTAGKGYEVVADKNCKPGTKVNGAYGYGGKKKGEATGSSFRKPAYYAFTLPRWKPWRRSPRNSTTCAWRRRTTSSGRSGSPPRARAVSGPDGGRGPVARRYAR